jgi:hypothetical protein
MPIPLRPKARADVVRMRKRETEAIDWLGLWALSLGFVLPFLPTLPISWVVTILALHSF